MTLRVETVRGFQRTAGDCRNLSLRSYEPDKSCVQPSTRSEGRHHCAAIGVSKNVPEGAGAQSSCTLAPDTASTVISRLPSPIAIIWPLLLIACASNRTTPRSVELALFR